MDPINRKIEEGHQRYFRNIEELSLTKRLFEQWWKEETKRHAKKDVARGAVRRGLK